MQQTTGLERLAADLGMTPDALALTIGVGFAIVIAVVALGCWALSRGAEPPVEPTSHPKPRGRGRAA